MFIRGHLTAEVCYETRGPFWKVLNSCLIFGGNVSTRGRMAFKESADLIQKWQQVHIGPPVAGGFRHTAF